MVESRASGVQHPFFRGSSGLPRRPRPEIGEA
jgi:hypothetical protein